jgi:hypothetical protein
MILKEELVLKGINALIKGTARARWRKYIPLRERAVTFDDLVQAGWLGLLEAKGRPPRDYIKRAVSREMALWHNAGGCSGVDTRLRRVITHKGRWNWAPERIQLKFPKLSIERIKAELAFAKPIKPSEMYRPPAEEVESNGVDLTYDAAEAVECEGVESKGYPANGLSQYSRSAGHHQWDWRLAKIVSDQGRQEAWRLQAMGPRAYADWLVNRKTTRPPPPHEQPAPFRSKVADRYRQRQQSIQHIQAMDEIVRLHSHLKPQLRKKAA